MARLLGIDIGTSACKVALFDEGGAVLAQADEAYPVEHPQPGWAQQDPQRWWRAVCLATRRVVEACGAKGIDGVGIAGQSWAAVMVDDGGNVLHDTPIWMDTRAQASCDEMERVVGRGALFDICGNPCKPSYTLPKLLWFREAMPDVYARCAQVLQANGFIAYRLTGALSQDLSQGYGYQCFDMRRGEWDETVLSALGIDAALLPPICACDHIVGGVTEAAARETGLPVGTPVVAGGLDAACSTLGAGVFSPGQTQEQGGQAGGMSICMDGYAADPRLILSRHVVPGRYLLQGGTVGGGGILRWLRAQVCPELSFDAMGALAQAAPPGSEGLVLLPYMAGERSPLWNPRAKGVFYGLDFAKTRNHLIRAGMEGVAFSLRHNLEVAREAGAAVTRLHAVGGSANSAVWTQIKADVTGCDIAVAASDVATTLGAAMLAGVGCGVWAGYPEAVAQTVRLRREYHPNEANRAAYDRGYAAYRELYERLAPMMGGETA